MEVPIYSIVNLGLIYAGGAYTTRQIVSRRPLGYFTRR